MKKLLTILITLILSIGLINVNTNKTSAEGEDITSFKIKGRDNYIYMRQNNTTTIEFEVEPAASGQSISYTCNYYGGLISSQISTAQSDANNGPKLMFGATTAGGVGYAVLEVTLDADPTFKQTITVVVDSKQKLIFPGDYIVGSGEEFTFICNDEFNQFMTDATTKKTNSFVKLKEKSTGATTTLEYGQGHYSVKEGCIVITFPKQLMSKLPAGTYGIEVKCNDLATSATGEFVVKNPDPTPEPQPKDESCEKVIGPTWHWNESKGICEEYATVGTSTR